ncbi:MAG TPA: glycoside hydrolase family 31 protein [Niabella sp.]|nr:glycoside hydrolase family 31 protein [Niabella sp.]HRC09695.1 glycoside hydrolase family 31 protein [Niabella sp.]
MAISLIAQNLSSPTITAVKKINPTTVELQLSDHRHFLLDFYGENIFRLVADSAHKSMHDPLAKPPAQILVNQPRKPFANLQINNAKNYVSIATDKLNIQFDKSSSLFQIKNLITGKIVVEEVLPIGFEKSKTVLTLKEQSDEYFFGGGVQNGRFSHKGKSIAIENQNSWTDGGVASPNPFYWSTNGYGVMWYTFKKGRYDFGAKQKNIVSLHHEADYLDVFFMVNDGAVALLNDFYQLTGHPVLLPKFAFYQGHLNAYNRDFWKEDSTGILFEDGKKYKESQKDNGGIKESLNGEKNNYPFSARAVVGRYKASDMPLGWVLPNDGYGAGYGQTGTLDSNILNLKSFGDYARKQGVEIGLWTQSDLHPKEGISALLQRDIVKEVRDAGVRVLKTDVAWVGAGYSFGLNGVADVAAITTRYGQNARPFIISLDGWAGTQRYASIWSGDQTGGQWEYIRFHIPTYIGSGLSGNPNISSDMDGIFGGKNVPVNVRDFQWKTFTPMQLNMDGWGSNPKYPDALGEPATSINRNYLKLKSELLPYTYTIAKTAVDGLPLIRAIFLEDPNAFTLGTATRYQFMYGPSFLVAPIYQDTKSDKEGNDIRHGIYLPKGTWFDYFTGEQYEGGAITNYFAAPLWKLPVFVKPGAIIPLANPNNNVSEINKAVRIYEVYPYGSSSFVQYDDDGTTEAYRSGAGVYTTIRSSVNKNHQATIEVAPSTGNFKGYVKEKETLFKINVSKPPTIVSATIGNKKLSLKKVNSLAAFNSQQNVYYFDTKPNLNQFATKGSDFEKMQINKNPQLLVKMGKTDITKNKVVVSVHGFQFNIPNTYKTKFGVPEKPELAIISEKNTGAFTLMPAWKQAENVDYYEISFNEMMYTHITDSVFEFDGLQPESDYTMKIRAVNKSGHSDWQTITGKTKPNPLQFAIHGITATSTAASQEGLGLNNLFDFDEGNDWHTKYGAQAVSFSLTLDLRSVNQLDKIQYLPRISGRNGIITKASIYYSSDKKNWILADSVSWARNNEVKEFQFANHPTARYLKFEVREALGNYGSGREIFVFKVPGTSGFIPGDINNDGKVDENDFTSYTNYTGLRKGDGDFEGYISNGDINKNDLIDAFDISNVATQLDGGVGDEPTTAISGHLQLSANKTNYKAGEAIEIKVIGSNLKNVNALSFALPYNQQAYEYMGIETSGTQKMENLTYDRLHTNGSKSLYPTFVNLGNKELLNGEAGLFTIKFKAKQNLKFNLKEKDGILVDRNLEVMKF